MNDVPHVLPRERTAVFHGRAAWVGPRIGLDAIVEKKKRLAALRAMESRSESGTGQISELSHFIYIKNNKFYLRYEGTACLHP